MSSLDLAISITAAEFAGKYDKGGKPYILHCLHVMNEVGTEDEELACIAVMHDLIEDTDFTIDILRELDFSDRVIWGVGILTHDKGDSYDHYIKLLSFNSDAVKVKLADLKHNSDITRIKGLRKKDFDRLEKYHRAYSYLKD